MGGCGFALALVMIVVLLVVGACCAQGQEIDYPWLGNQLGVTDEAPAPWTPVQVGENNVSVWGKTFTWNGGPLPAQITSQGEELLYYPADLHVQVAAPDLVPFPKADQQVIEQTEASVTLAHSTQAGAFTLETTTTIEFDGFCRVRMTLTPDGPAHVDAVRLNIPLRSDVADVFSRYLNYDFATQRTDKKTFATSLQRIDGTIYEPFNPEVWLGNKQVGLCWAAETNVAWLQEDLDSAIGVIPGEQAVQLQVAFIDHAVTLTEPLEVEFALMPTPIKPVDPRLRMIRMGASSRCIAAKNHGIGEDICEWYAIAFGGELDPLYDSFPFPGDTDKSRDAVQKLRDNDVGFIPYGAMAYTNAMFADARQMYEQWHTLPVSQATLGRYEKYEAGETEDYAKANWGHWEGYRVCMTPESYHDFFVDMWVRAIREHDVAGMYLDHGEVSHGCQNPNHEHFIDPKTQPGKYFYGIFGARELLKRLWIASKAEKPEIVTVLHQSRPSKLLNSFLDICASGEVINVYFCGENTSRDVIADPALYVPDYDLLPDVFFEMEFLDSYGFDSRILPEVKFCNQQYLKDNPELATLWTSVLMKNTLLSGARLYAGNMDQQALEDMWRGMDSIGPIEPEVSFHPWHSNAAMVAATAQTTRVSFYQRPGKTLVIVGNDAAEAVNERVTLSTGDTYVKAVDAQTGDEVALANSTVTLTVPARVYRMVLLTTE